MILVHLVVIKYNLPFPFGVFAVLHEALQAFLKKDQSHPRLCLKKLCISLSVFYLFVLRLQEIDFFYRIFSFSSLPIPEEWLSVLPLGFLGFDRTEK